jgi:fucose permease
MNYFKHKKKCNPTNKPPFFKFTEILGLLIAIIGAIIIVQILPVKIWMFILGMLLIILGITLFRLL